MNSLGKNDKSIKNQPTSKKIGFFSAILLVIGSSIGAGIFLKNNEILNNVYGSIVFSLIAWFIAVVAILAMGMTLAELSSGSGSQNDQGIIGWVKTFNSRFLYKGAKNFMAYIYLPINYFVMSFYTVMMLQDAFNFQLDWYFAALIALGIILWFSIISGLFSHIGNIQNWIITSVKFIPLAFAIVIGFVMLAINGQPENPAFPDPADPTWQTTTPLFSQLCPVLGIFTSIPAIFFAFDGFYATAGIQTQMKEPKKTSMAMAIGLASVSFIDVMISISLLLGSPDGTINGIKFLEENLGWLLTLMQVLIAFGILGIINGFAIYTPRYYEDLIREKEIPFTSTYVNKLNPDKPNVGVIVTLILTIPLFIIFTLVGAFAFIDTGHYGSVYGNDMDKLYSLVDLMANWTSILAFACIISATIGALINRKTKKIKTCKSKWFIPCAFISTTIVGVGIIFILIQTIANIILVSGYVISNAYASSQEAVEYLVGTIMMGVILIVFLTIMFVPAQVAIHRENKNKR